MKVIKVLIGILILLSLVLTATVFFTYQAFNYSFLSYDENVAILSNGAFFKAAIEDLADVEIDEIKGLKQLLKDENLANFNKTGIAKFINSAFQNSLAYVFLKNDKLQQFDKQFIYDFKNDSISAVLNTATDNAAYDALAENLKHVDQATAKTALSKMLEGANIEFNEQDVDKILAKLYNDGEPTREKLTKALNDFANEKITIVFEPEKAIEKALYVPRTVVKSLDDIFGKLLLINIVLLILLLIVTIYRRNAVALWLFFSALLSLALLQLLRIIRYQSILEQFEDSKMLSSYYEKMSALFIRNINYISIAMLAATAALIIILLIWNKLSPSRDKDDPTHRFKTVRLLLTIAIIGAIGYFNYIGYNDVKELQDNLKSYDFEKEFENLDNFEDIFEFKIDL